MVSVLACIFYIICIASGVGFLFVGIEALYLCFLSLIIGNTFQILYYQTRGIKK